MTPGRNLTAEQIASLQSILDAVLEEDWFNRNAVTEKELAKLLLTLHAEGLRGDALKAQTTEQARTRFSRTR